MASWGARFLYDEYYSLSVPIFTHIIYYMIFAMGWYLSDYIIPNAATDIYTRKYDYIDSKAGTYLLFYINQLPYMTVIVVVV